MSVTGKMIEAHAKPNRDIFGNRISVGTLVRSFDHPLLTSDGKILGLETECTGTNRVQYVEGVIEEIGDQVIEGCPRYTLRITKEVCYCEGTYYKESYGAGHRIYPPLNGTPKAWGMGVTFGVTVVTD